MIEPEEPEPEPPARREPRMRPFFSDRERGDMWREIQADYDEDLKLCQRQ